MIVYFSQSGQNLYRGQCQYLNVGNTALVARAIARCFPQPIVAEIRPIIDYPDEYQQVLKITKHELDERTFPKIMPITADIAGSNHIILAFPNWWNHLPRPIVTFMEQYQWQDKTIYPVCTHEGNRFGDSLNELSEIA
ncbi:flavodoxin [Pediococcus pentosaceus]|uniref:flavodoxin n=1 Tax=Pediococcus pentosaceus TaxID=1255 RepID=UPI0031899D0A